jgi:D-inositol-3-phosphate glycosyltransferase
MKTTLLTLNIGNVLRENSRASFQSAARRWGCDYIEVTEMDTPFPHAMKLKCFELTDADRVFYADADIVISANCPNPFEVFPEDAFVAANNQQDQMTEACRNACADNIARDLRDIMAMRGLGETKNYPATFINSGVWLASRTHHMDVLALALGVSLKMEGKTAWKDQSALNYALIHTETAVLMPSSSWNYQFPPDTGSGPMEHFIYHWAGGEDRDQIDGINWQSFRCIEFTNYCQKPKLLLIADHDCPTGFARVAENICRFLKESWEIHVIGINYNGTPHSFPYPIYPAKLYGDIWGLGTLNQLIPRIQPDAILTIQDPWIASLYATEIERYGMPFAAYMPIDARNQDPRVCQKLNRIDLALFYTKFGEVEIRVPGYKGPSDVIPHGVDTDIYRPIPKEECRKHLNDLGMPENVFIVGNVNRNQPRKRLDLTIQYFAEWIKRVAGDARQRITNAYLYLHCAQRDSAGWDLTELAHFYGIGNRLIIPDIKEVTPACGIPENEMPYVYGSFDVQVSTTCGEGWGLSQIEGMACSIPQIVPQFAALGEWAAPGAYMVPVSDERITHSVVNTIGAIPEKDAFIRALDTFYKSPELRDEYSKKALTLARKQDFTWESVAKSFDRDLKEMIIRVRAQAEAKRETERKEKNNAEIPEETGSQQTV